MIKSKISRFTAAGIAGIVLALGSAGAAEAHVYQWKDPHHGGYSTSAQCYSAIDKQIASLKKQHLKGFKVVERRCFKDVRWYSDLEYSAPD